MLKKSMITERNVLHTTFFWSYFQQNQLILLIPNKYHFDFNIFKKLTVNAHDQHPINNTKWGFLSIKLIHNAYLII